MKIIDPEGFQGTMYYAENIVCNGCKKEFCYTVKIIEDGERFCKLCYNHRFGIKEMQEVEQKLDDLGNYLWEIPIVGIKPEIKEKLHWVKRKVKNTHN